MKPYLIKYLSELQKHNGYAKTTTLLEFALECALDKDEDGNRAASVIKELAQHHLDWDSVFMFAQLGDSACKEQLLQAADKELVLRMADNPNWLMDFMKDNDLSN